MQFLINLYKLAQSYNIHKTLPSTVSVDVTFVIIVWNVRRVYSFFHHCYPHKSIKALMFLLEKYII